MMNEKEKRILDKSNHTVFALARGPVCDVF